MPHAGAVIQDGRNDATQPLPKLFELLEIKGVKFDGRD
jgi:hypothetical protein